MRGFLALLGYLCLAIFLCGSFLWSQTAAPEPMPAQTPATAPTPAMGISPTPVAATAPKPSGYSGGTVQRKVLIFDFENQTGKIDFDYLSGSIADALADSVKKTGKFRLMLREDARVNSYADSPVAPGTQSATTAAPAASNQNVPPAANGTGAAASAAPVMKVKVDRTEAIKQGHAAGADVVVLGKYTELNGVLLMSAQAYETDTRLLKVSEDVLTKSDSEMFNGINILAAKIAESMARELPMFDAAEAARRRAALATDKIEERDWEIQLFTGMPLLHPLYSSDGTITYAKGFPVQKLTGYSIGATIWNSSLARKIYFLPKESRFGLQTKLTLLSGTADAVDTNGALIVSNAPLNGVFVSSHLMFGVPYFQWRKFAAFADLGLGAVYTNVTNSGTKIFLSVQPSVVVGTSAAWHFSYWSLGLSYSAQVAFFSQSQAFMQHDFC